MIKSKRQIIEELIAEHMNMEIQENKLESMGIRVPSFKYQQLHDWALDLIGFPADNTEDGDFSKPDCFCRDYLFDHPLFQTDTITDMNREVSEYVDWLYVKYQEFLDESNLK